MLCFHVELQQGAGGRKFNAFSFYPTSINFMEVIAEKCGCYFNPIQANLIISRENEAIVNFEVVTVHCNGWCL